MDDAAVNRDIGIGMTCNNSKGLTATEGTYIYIYLINGLINDRRLIAYSNLNDVVI